MLIRPLSPTFGKPGAELRDHRDQARPQSIRHAAQTPAQGRGQCAPQRFVQELVSPLFSQSAAAGALPTLFAATSPTAQGGAYYGPDGMAEMRGAPTVARIASQAQDRVAAARLWQVSEQLTGVTFEVPVAA